MAQSPYLGTAKAETRTPLVIEALDLLERRITELSERVDALEPRLAPILRTADTANKPAPQLKATVTVELAGRIHAQTDRIFDLTTRLECLQERIEV